MNLIKRIDEKLMDLLTYSLFYPDLDDRPQTRIAILPTLIAVEITIFAVTLQNNLLLAATVPFWLIAFYEWRLWFRLRRQR